MYNFLCVYAHRQAEISWNWCRCRKVVLIYLSSCQECVRQLTQAPAWRTSKVGHCRLLKLLKSKVASAAREKWRDKGTPLKVAVAGLRR